MFLQQVNILKNLKINYVNTNSKYAIAVNSGTSALHASLIVAGVKQR